MPSSCDPFSKQSNATPLCLSAFATATLDDPAAMMETPAAEAFMRRPADSGHASRA
jgi:hypothetical protein